MWTVTITRAGALAAGAFAAVVLLGCDAAPVVPRACEEVPEPPFVPARVDEPAWEVEPLWVEERPAGGAFDVSLWYPATVSAYQALYPISEGSNVPFRIRYRVGQEDTTTAVTALVLVDGRVAHVQHHDEVVSRVAVPLPIGHAITDTITIPAAELRPGLNRVDLVHFIHRNGGFRALLGPSFTVANGSVDGRPVADSPDLESGTYAPGWQTIAYRTIAAAPELGETPFVLWTPAAGILDTPTHLSVRLQANSPRSSCEPYGDNPDELMLIAFRDMEPVPMGDLDRVMARIPRGEQRIFRFDFHPDFPEDEFHHYVIIELAGFSRSARRDSGGLTPWTQASIVTEVFWGWRPSEE